MPRLTCDWYGCSHRPILAVTRRMVEEHAAYLNRVGGTGGIVVTGERLLTIAGAERWYPRLCVDHARIVGVEQLEQPRVYVQSTLL